MPDPEPRGRKQCQQYSAAEQRRGERDQDARDESVLTCQFAALECEEVVAEVVVRFAQEVPAGGERKRAGFEIKIDRAARVAPPLGVGVFLAIEVQRIANRNVVIE